VSSGPPSIATYNGQLHPLHGIWPVAQEELLDLTIKNGMRAVRDWTLVCGAKECAFPKTATIDPFFNVNTADELNLLAKTQNARSFDGLRAK
jgi:molybdopterin-guanine dinucleotide biosynthesis protein A